MVLDPDDRKVLYVRHLNASVVEVFGVFYWKESGPIIASETGTTYAGGRGGLSKFCVESMGSSEPLFAFAP